MGLYHLHAEFGRIGSFFGGRAEVLMIVWDAVFETQQHALEGAGDLMYRNGPLIFIDIFQN